MVAKNDPGSERPSLRERNKQRIIQRIIDASCALFRDPGYEQTTMEMIAEKAEVSRGTLFNYFSTKTALLVPYAGELYEQQIQPEILAYLETQPATLEILRFIFLTVGERILTLHGLIPALQHELHHSRPTMKTIMSHIGFLETLQKILRLGQQKGEVRADLSAERLSHYIGALYISLLQEMSATQTETMTAYVAEVETLLAFLRSAFQP